MPYKLILQQNYLMKIEIEIYYIKKTKLKS